MCKHHLLWQNHVTIKLLWFWLRDRLISAVVNICDRHVFNKLLTYLLTYLLKTVYYNVDTISDWLQVAPWYLRVLLRRLSSLLCWFLCYVLLRTASVRSSAGVSSNQDGGTWNMIRVRVDCAGVWCTEWRICGWYSWPNVSSSTPPHSLQWFSDCVNYQLLSWLQAVRILSTHISHGSVATCLMCGGMFSDRFIANSYRMPVNIRWKYGQEYDVSFFDSPCSLYRDAAVALMWLWIRNTLL